MKKFNIYAVALATLTTFSCAQQEDEVPLPFGNDPISVNLRVAPSDLDSKKVETPAITGDLVDLNNGLVFFLNAQDDVVDVREMLTSEIKLPAGQTFNEIKPTATNVYIVANAKFIDETLDGKLRACKTKVEIKAVSSSIANQQNSHKFVVLSNTIDRTAYPTMDGVIKKEGSLFKACVLLAPVLCRIQIADIKGDGTIVSFKLGGIFIDNFYPLFYMATDNGGAGTIYSVGQNGANLGVGNGSILSDRPTNPIADGGDLKVTATDIAGFSGGSYVCGYQLAPTSGGVANIPHIILMFTEITVKNSDGAGNVVYTTPRYVTVKGFKNALGEDITKFVAGNIYNIPADGFVFGRKDLSDMPNPLNVSVSVCATIKPWQVATITPKL